MTTYIRYQTATGEIDSVGSTDTEVLPFDMPDGYSSMQGYGSNATHYVQDGEIMEYTIEQQISKINKPSYKCAWSNTTFAWSDIRTPEEQNSDAEGSVISKRDMLLNQSDWVVVRAIDQGTPIPTDWQTYRQALRDISTQSGYPTNVVWPVAPA